MKLTLKQKIMVIVGIIGASLILLFQQGLSDNPQAEKLDLPKPTQEEALGDPKVTSTNPDPLEEAVVLPTQAIEITFNYPLENRGELKYRLDPKIDVEIRLSDDRKTAKIMPAPNFKLGTGYTLFIEKNETKFDGGKRLGQDYQYHFRTIDYSGI